MYIKPINSVLIIIFYLFDLLLLLYMHELQFTVMVHFGVLSISCAWFLFDSRPEMADVVEKKIANGIMQIISVQFSGYLLKCNANITSGYCKVRHK